MSDLLTVLRAARPMAKIWRADGSIDPYQGEKFFRYEAVEVASVRSLSAVLTELEVDPYACVIRGTYAGDPPSGLVRRLRDLYDDTPHHWVLIEVDEYEPVCADPVLQPEEAIAEFVLSSLPPEFWEVTCHWQLSNSAGRVPGKLKAHLWYWMDEAASSVSLRAWAKGTALPIDRAVFNVVQVHYTAAPLMDPGVVDPVPRRSGLLEGVLGDVVYIDLPEAPPAPVRPSGEPLVDMPTLTGALAYLAEHYSVVGISREDWLHVGMALHYETDGDGIAMWDDWSQKVPGYEGWDDISARWDSFDGAAVPITGGTVLRMAREAGWVEVVPDDAYEPLSSAEPAPVRMPTATSLCTDQANANRLLRHFKKSLMVMGGSWYAWSNTHWEKTDSAAWCRSMMLSQLIVHEADWREETLRAEIGEEAYADRRAQHESLPKYRRDDADLVAIDALRAWAKASEMETTIGHALKLLGRAVEVDPDAVDADPWALNCLNGTVDLRTGVLRPHNADDRITKIAPVVYDPEARAPLFERALDQIVMGDKTLARFLQRWFGYCATGSTREQKFVVHWGGGANGKSTLLDAVASVLGGYASTAPAGLLTQRRDGTNADAPAIAELKGRRMVTAHESDEGSQLREGFVKAATGTDRLVGRHLYKSHIEFTPTHKLQLLTNHKPSVRGQDVGIWRRVLLVPFKARFGDVSKGATHEGDPLLPEKLRAEYPGILAWLVRGAVQWFAEGLRAPDTVLAASLDYQQEQDRIALFVSECCEVGPEFWAPLGGRTMFGERPSLYAAYTEWCKESNFFPVGKLKFEAELERVVPRFRKIAGDKRLDDSGVRRKIVKIYGLRVLSEN